MNFVLAFHNHQPVGNFENIFREAFEKCYEPFLAFLEKHPFFRVSLHYSGCLFDWLEGREKQFLRRLARLVKQNQVELLSGGYYEPILPLVPERDAIGQLRFMNEYLKRRFGKSPGGFWLAERVWEGKLPRIAAQAGLSYTAVDDTHFTLAGLAESEIRNFFVTEEEGFPLYLFPIPKHLRYAIPFHEPDKTLAYLGELSHEKPQTDTVTYADDGEKFGLWPGTYQWVYRDGWLARFAEALEKNRTWISLKTFSEVLEDKLGNPVKKAYLPNASYEEMAEWSLSRQKAYEFREFKKELESAGLWSRARVFIQGGTFKNFLAKYPEADWMRCKMKWVSDKVARVKNPSQRRKAERELWQGQCNCPYWHGVFGGLYLHHLRRSTYEHLLRAEELSRLGAKPKSPEFTLLDLNQDGSKEGIIESQPFSFYFLPHRGGALAELDFHPVAMNLLDTLTRREEVYHRELGDKKEPGGGRSIHEMNKTISREAMERVAFDRYERFSYLDHFLAPETRFEEFWKGGFHALGGDPTKISYVPKWKPQKGKGILSLRGEIPLDTGGGGVILEKRIQIKLGEAKFEIGWTLTSQASRPLELLWGSEWNFNFFDRERNENEIRQVQIQDGWSPVHLEITGAGAFDYWQFPIETVAQTEQDFRLIHQGISVFPHWRLILAPGETCYRSLTFIFQADGRVDP